MKAAGVARFISAFLGHASLSFTDKVYGTLFPDVSRAVANLAADIIPGTSEESR
jgi:integrase